MRQKIDQWTLAFCYEKVVCKTGVVSIPQGCILHFPPPLFETLFTASEVLLVILALSLSELPFSPQRGIKHTLIVATPFKIIDFYLPWSQKSKFYSAVAYFTVHILLNKGKIDKIFMQLGDALQMFIAGSSSQSRSRRKHANMHLTPLGFVKTQQAKDSSMGAYILSWEIYEKKNVMRNQGMVSILQGCILSLPPPLFETLFLRPVKDF